MSDAADLVQVADRLWRESEGGDVDHDAVNALTERVLALGRDTPPDEARTLHASMQRLMDRVQAQRDEVRTQLGGLAKKNRAIRGFGRSRRHSPMLRGQRVNKGV